MLRIFRHSVPVSIIMLAFCEILLIFFAWHFSLVEKPLSDFLVYNIARSPSLPLSLLAGGVMVLSGLYHSKIFVDYRTMSMQVVLTFALLIPITVAWCAYREGRFVTADALLAIDWKVLFTWVLCIFVTRIAFLNFVNLKVFKRRVLVLGAGRKAARIAALATGRNIRHFVPVAYLRCGIDPGLVPAYKVDVNTASPDAIADCAVEARAREIVVATDDRRGLPVSALLRCRTAGIHVIDYLDFIERETKTVDLAALQPGWLIFSDGFRHSRLRELLKRSFDIVLSLALLLFTLPLMLLSSVLIAIESPGSILYRQERVGLNGRPFSLLKFRSMCGDAEKDGVPRWAVTGDPRVTRVGWFIRKLRIDELPQLLNVLRGDMSLVGPRPERPAFVEDFNRQIPFYAERHCVKPGITGWAQINYPYGASLEDARNKLSYDLYYVKNHGLFLDLMIVLQTFRVILCADGSR
jgi:sugar transferase (PEP-CTERM system associated)